MGIRVECPNGHKLHVKEALAGRRGVCPDCGARVDIPAISSATPDESAASAPNPLGERAATELLAGSAMSEDVESALWYIRLAQGGQYGPATIEVVRQWVQEGRITADSMVWRTGWPDWRPGSECLPLSPPPAPDATIPLVPPVVPPGTFGSDANLPAAMGSLAATDQLLTQVSRVPLTAHDRERAKKLRRGRRQKLTAAMALLVAILAGVLAFLLIDRDR